jgi:ATP:ADP antiporter, AAA family
MLGNVGQGFKDLAIGWFGNFSRQELKKFFLLGFIFFFTIGVYWLIRVTKDGVFMNVVGGDYLPIAKWLSLVVVVPLVIIYGKLTDIFPRHRVFYALCAIYGVLGLLFAYFIQHPTIGMPNVEVDPWRMLGWSYYVYVESFGSIMVALFWSFVADITSPESAKRGYPVISLGGQLGGIFGPLFVSTQAEKLGTGIVIAMGAGAIFVLAAMVWYFMKVTPSDQLVGFHGTNEAAVEKKEKAKVGFSEGLSLVLSQKYLLGIFAIISLYEVVVTIFDFQFKVLASQVYSGDQLTAYLGGYGVWVNSVAALCILLGVNNIARFMGLTAALTLLPVIIGGAVILLNLKLSLAVAFYIMVLSKALNYALNQPSKEQLYIPTTKEAKYKAKAWIEMFGSRSSKAFGSAINLMKQILGSHMFVTFSTLVSLGLCGAWFFIALYLGRTHKNAVDNKKVVC